MRSVHASLLQKSADFHALQKLRKKDYVTKT
jgi:hypothetical protein